LFPPSASAAPPRVSVRIHPLARLDTDGSVAFRVHVRCGPLPGSPDVRQANAGVSQPRRGAAGEGGLSPDVVCNGRWRGYTATVSATSANPFSRDLAVASVAVNACNAVGSSQVCVNGSARHVVFLWGRPHAPTPPPPPPPPDEPPPPPPPPDEPS
jgi:hypothetical protein